MPTKDLSFPERPTNFGESRDALREIDQRIRDYQAALAQNDIGWFVESGIIEADVRRGSRRDMYDIFDLRKRVTASFTKQFPEIDFLETKKSKHAPLPISPNKSNYPLISEFVDPYMNSRKWQVITVKEKRASCNRIDVSINLIGDLPLERRLRNGVFWVLSEEL